MFTFNKFNLLAMYLLCIFIVNIARVDCLSTSEVNFPGPEPGFSDISLNNFLGYGLNETRWTYKYFARTGHTLSLNFLTKLEGNVDIKVYDGPNNKSSVIDISSILNNGNFSLNVFQAPYISSTGKTMFIEITALQFNHVPYQDFQAIVTDHQNQVSAGCGSIVTAVTKGNSATQLINYIVNMTGNNCINVLRTVDITNSPTVTSYVQFSSGTQNMKVYKGMELMPRNELICNVNPLMVTDRNVIIQRTAPAEVIYSWGHLSPSVNIRNFDSILAGSLMTRDYVPFQDNYFQTKFTQQFVFQPSTPPNGTTFALEFTILANLGKSILQIASTDTAGNPMQQYDVTDNGALPQKLSVTGSIIQLTYKNTDLPYKTGLYATYQQITPMTKSSMRPMSIMTILVTLVLMY